MSVCVEQLTKRYGSVEAVRGISFQLNPGEIFGLLGPNGAGKTTTLECILGLRRPDAGTITVDGVDVVARPAEARRRIGAQLQSAALQDKITPREVLRLFGSFHRGPATTVDLIERFGLAEKADATFDSLSGGQRQRLFLALAFVNDPRVLVLDEPTAGLDAPSRRDLHDMIAGMKSDGRTVLLSTHDLDEAAQLCDRVGIIDHGQLVALARPADLIDGAGAKPKIAVSSIPPLQAGFVASLPAVTRTEPQGDGWLLSTSDIDRTMAALIRAMEASGNRLVDLRIQRPSLEDVYLTLTGRAWKFTAEEEN